MNQMDLHIHTHCSDSSLSVQEVISYAQDIGLKAISITDHDTFRAYEQLDATCLPIRLIKGIELSAYDEQCNQSVHILGYGFSKETPHVDALCERVNQQMIEKALWQIEQLQTHGYPIRKEAVLENAKNSSAIYKQHLLSELIQQGVCSDLYSSFYQTTFKQGGICDRRISYPSIQETIQAIHNDHGIAVLAHPFASHVEQDLYRIYRMGINGIEVYHSSHTKEMVAYLHAFAKTYAILETGGSDHHGTYGKEPMIGEVNEYWQSEGACLCRMNV